MKVVILAGGFGTRLSEYTDSIPKPMVCIGGRPILWHIMKLYSSYNYKDFFIALGYKAEIIKQYFLHYKTLNSDFMVDLGSGEITPYGDSGIDWTVTMKDTGLNTMTGGRVKQLQEYIGNETFLLTYGDGVADIDISALVDFHNSHGKMVTVSGVRPSARFGELELNGNQVISFKEKPQISQGWVNGGFFVINPEFFSLIDGDSTILEQEPLEVAAQRGELMVYQHKGFWQCMDAKRDRDLLEQLWASGNAPWMT